jgi:hypothetical protein
VAACAAAAGGSLLSPSSQMAFSAPLSWPLPSTAAAAGAEAWQPAWPAATTAWAAPAPAPSSAPLPLPDGAGSSAPGNGLALFQPPPPPPPPLYTLLSWPCSGDNAAGAPASF